jgi:hypothetical protein
VGTRITEKSAALSLLFFALFGILKNSFPKVWILCVSLFGTGSIPSPRGFDT